MTVKGLCQDSASASQKLGILSSEEWNDISEQVTVADGALSSHHPSPPFLDICALDFRCQDHPKAQDWPASQTELIHAFATTENAQRRGEEQYHGVEPYKGHLYGGASRGFTWKLNVTRHMVDVHDVEIRLRRCRTRARRAASVSRSPTITEVGPSLL
jgi:hypothetical protein